MMKFSNLRPFLSPSSSSHFSTKFAPRFFSSTPTTFNSTYNSLYKTRIVGTHKTQAYRVFIEPNDPNHPNINNFSPWHHIPLLSSFNSNPNKLYNYINEIPIGTRPKYEVATKESLNPIKQDIKKGELRDFTYGNIPFNYGCLPQTWENSLTLHKDTGCKGDNDPLDIVEISEKPLLIGQVIPVKLLGIFALIDEGETDWKLLAIAINNPKFNKINNIKDIEREMGKECIDKILHWYRYYKTTDGKPENIFAFNGKVLDLDYAENIVQETHHDWKSLLEGKIPPNKLWLPNSNTGTV